MHGKTIELNVARQIWSHLTRELNVNSTVTMPLLNASQVFSKQGQEKAARESSEPLQPNFLKSGQFSLNGLEMPYHYLTCILTSSFVPTKHVIEIDTLNNDNYTVAGNWNLKHTRSFIGWEASQCECVIPYTASMTFDGVRLHRLSLKADYLHAFMQIGMPSKIKTLLENKESLKVFSSLRSIGVKPEVITYNALLGVAIKKPSWMNAMHLM
ncbi:hypothetical protein XU18_2163 [Perkinsela sp. CCAP 1560/4]|nr:hypothetical protein XU18_2163 [Perkinsela sp. CCAP 1560/4]|eukprot:KNH07118.1 hypothetical protein XU18_2163 [Perkinsela sp. CCAP 1560/4]